MKGEVKLPADKDRGIPEATIKYEIDVSGCCKEGDEGKEVQKVIDALKYAASALQTVTYDLKFFTQDRAKMAATAVEKIKKNLTHWFGTTTDKEIDDMAKKSYDIFGESYKALTSKTITVKCDPKCKNTGAAYSTHRFLLGFTKNTIMLCPGFFDGPLGGKVQTVAHTIIHELAHQYGDFTKDYGYVWDAARGLYRINGKDIVLTADELRKNPDTYAWFVQSGYFRN